MLLTISTPSEFCPDGTPKIPEIGCIKAPASIAPANTDPSVIAFSTIDALIAAAGGVAILFIVWGALQYADSGGDDEKKSNAKRTIVWAIFGLLIALFSKTVVVLITD